MVFGFETALARAAVLRDNLNHMTTPTEPTTAVDTRPDRRRGTLSGAAAVLLWATLAALTALSGDIPPFQLLAMSFALAFLVGVGLWVWEDRRAPKPARRSVFRRFQLPPAAWALGIYGLFGYHFAYFTAMRLAPPVEAGLINYLWPLLIVVFAGFLPGERLRGRQIAGALLGFAGAALIVTRGQGFYVDPRYAGGYLFAVAAGVIWASYSVLSRRMRDVPTSAVGAFCAATAVLALLCHLALEETVRPSAVEWLAVLGLGLGPVGAAFYVWDYGVKHGNIQTLGALAYSIPLLSTALLVVLGLAEATWALAAAAALITGGAVLASWRR